MGSAVAVLGEVNDENLRWIAVVEARRAHRATFEMLKRLYCVGR
jgi:hypothetical protein